MEAHQTEFIESFEREIEVRKVLVNQCIQDCLQYNYSVANVLKEAMEYSVYASGKRIRPILVLEAGKLFSDSEQRLLDFSVAVELLHTYSLIHDDLPCMDDSDFRRGKATCHKVYGDDIATLAGDALLTFAWDLLIQMGDKHKVDSQTVLQVVSLLSQAVGANGMIAGQVLDLQAEANPDINPQQLEQIHTYKTGKLFIACLEMGALLCSADASRTEALREYGRHFGLVFQITDDLLDLTGTTEELGKTAGSDLLHEKSTYPALFGMDRSREMARNHAQEGIEVLNKAFSPKKCEFLSSLMNYLLVRTS